jgi:hypothetical protein
MSTITFLHIDGEMSPYVTDKEHKSCLNTDEEYQFHLDTVHVQRSLRDDPVLK